MTPLLLGSAPLSGVLAPVPTPFDRDGALDRRRLRTGFEYWAATPLAGVVVLGTNGEAALLDDRESDEVIAEARLGTPGNRWLLAGVGRESTSATIGAARRAAALGVDAVLVRTPSAYKSQMTPAVLDYHFRAVADASTVPILLYNFAASTGVNLLPSTVAALSQHANVVGIKESGSDIPQISDFVELTPPSFVVMAGSASTFLSALLVGADGGVLALSAVLPRQCVAVHEAYLTGDLPRAKQVQRQLLPLARLLSTLGVAGLKAALSVMGFDAGYPRRPLGAVDEGALRALEAALAPFGEHGA